MFHDKYDTQVTEPLKASSDRVFGFVIGTACILIAVYQYFSQGVMSHLSFGLFGIASVLWFVAIIKPRYLKRLNKMWMLLALAINKLTNPIIMGLLFFFIITPIGLIMRMLGKDILYLQRSVCIPSYWKERCPSGPAPETMSNQF